MKMKYNPQQSGYITVLRDFQKLLSNKELSFSLLGAYLLFVFQADWDRRHNNCRAILPDDKDLAKLWNCHISTVYRMKKKLVKLGLIEFTNEVYYIKNLSLFETGTIKSVLKKNLANVHIYYSKTESELSKKLFEIEQMQET